VTNLTLLRPSGSMKHSLIVHHLSGLRLDPLALFFGCWRHMNFDLEWGFFPGNIMDIETYGSEARWYICPFWTDIYVYTYVSVHVSVPQRTFISSHWQFSPSLILTGAFYAATHPFPVPAHDRPGDGVEESPRAVHHALARPLEVAHPIQNGEKMGTFGEKVS
jgi:hypothetical protein